MSEIKLCKDCKNYKEEENSYYSNHYQNHIIKMFPDYFCLKDVKYEINIVNGNKQIISGEKTLCFEQRAEISHLENRCGKEAKYFEAK